MWHISTVTDPTYAQIWFSDTKAIDQPRGGDATSHRLIVDEQGFLDITEFDLSTESLLDFNNDAFIVKKSGSASIQDLHLTLHGEGRFTVAIGTSSPDQLLQSISGTLKPFQVVVSKGDIEFFDQMITKGYVPFRSLKSPGKTLEEIKALGKQHFPLSPYSFYFAMAVYDWTTASFMRMVLMRVFEYTSIQQTPLPLDSASVASMIWLSNWDEYKPSNQYYMKTFLMQPSKSLAEVQDQLKNVELQLQNFGHVGDRILQGAAQLLPRTSVIAKPHLFSGQVDVYQFGLERFGVEFLQCPLNSGPVGEQLVMAFATVMSTFAAAGNTITTKMTWSFTDTIQDAIHYSNGILLVANPPESTVWEAATYITPLSNDLTKTEWVFPPRTSFLVQDVRTATVDGKQIVVITLQPQALVKPEGTVQSDRATRQGDAIVPVLRPLPLETDKLLKRVAEYSDELEKQVKLKQTVDGPQYHVPHETGGRRCKCVDKGEELIAGAGGLAQ